MKLFNNYLNSIDTILNKNQLKTFSSELSSNVPSYFEKGSINLKNLNESNNRININTENKVLLEFDNNLLVELFGTNPDSFNSFEIGTHPDFSDLKHFEYENHFCVTMFMDIVGSTRLNGKYTLLEIRKIKDTILSLAIQVTSHFGGHVHRLQGDGIMIQFVRKSSNEQNSVINALNASSILTNFISKDLAEHFNNNGIKPLRVRIGIDLGFKEDVIWSHYGVKGCSELTTTSLHTDLAAKLQSQSKSNGILIGGNIKQILDIKAEFCQDLLTEQGTIDYYCYQGTKNYRKFNFNWFNYLNSFDFYKKTSNGNLDFEIPRFRLKCFIKGKNNLIGEEYFQNSYAIPKEYEIKFEIWENKMPYHRKQYETIEWTAFNSGTEAINAGHETHDFGGSYKNLTICETTTAYIGHHYVECIVKRPHSENIRIKFPLFIK